MPLSPELAERYEALRTIVRPLKRAIVAYSGGVDSALLAKVVYDELGAGLLAVTARSPSLPRRELEHATSVAEQVGFAHRIIETDEMADRNYTENPANRCYFCKSELFARLHAVARAAEVPWILYGENADDASDYRPGAKAAVEQGVRAPLKEAGLTKQDVRELARSFGLPVWDKPAFACLSSRFPTGVAITPARLAKVEACEDLLWALGLRQFRVRFHGDVARIEVEPSDQVKLLALGSVVTERFRAAGFTYVTMDLLGYRRGGLNPVLIDPALPVLE